MPEGETEEGETEEMTSREIADRLHLSYAGLVDLARRCGVKASHPGCHGRGRITRFSVESYKVMRARRLEHLRHMTQLYEEVLKDS